ncbi:carbon starvation protein A [Candidatus Sumerlaeota bacterium]|nr:carbon starvation protein A [Candidatus Sumerlaeota bacterium]
MNILFPVAVAAALFVIALRLYPRVISRAFQEDDGNPPPSERLADGRDYVKSRTSVVFGHHFATIAGAGPIVGPTLALAYGWQPVWLWVVIGGIFFGAVHDMCAMFASVREDGKSIAEVAHRTLGPVGYLLMILVLIFVLTIINAIFLNLSVMALTSTYDLDLLHLSADQGLLRTVTEDGVIKGRIGGIATTSVIIITAFAPVLAYLIRRRGLSTAMAFLLSSVVAAVSIIIGFQFPIVMAGNTWAWVMTAYVLIAGALPVWLILQPRDFTNVQILYGGLLLICVAAIIAGLRGRGFEAPAWDIEGGTAARGLLWPMLFITVACGAISGFHSLVSSGTSSKQIPRESDCRRVGYGGMVLESFFAILVLVAVASMPRGEYLALVYPEGGAPNWVLGFALGAGHLINAAIPLIPLAIATVLGILMIEGFVVTTLDSSVRLCRYMIEEFWVFVFGGKAPALFRRPEFNVACAVGLMVFFYLNTVIKGLWSVFGAGNQLMAALAMTTVSVWLVQRARKHLFALIPALFMIATTVAALIILIRANIGTEDKWLLGWTSAALLFLSVGVVVVGATRFFQAMQANARQPTPAEAGGS